MPLLEMLIPIALFFYLIWRRPRPFVVQLFPIAALLLMLIHFVIEGYRWQMIPLYVLTAIFAVRTLTRLRSAAEQKPSLSIRLAQGSALFLLAVSTALPILLPVPSLPTPSGPYQVG